MFYRLTLLFVIIGLIACKSSTDSFGTNEFASDIEKPSTVKDLEIIQIETTSKLSPKLNFEPATDDFSGILNYEVQILNSQNNSVVVDWTKANKLGQISAPTLQKYVKYYLKIRARDRSGKVGPEVRSEDFLAYSNLCVGDKLTSAPYAGGTGTLSDPFQICTAQQFIEIGNQTNDLRKIFSIDADLDFSGTSFVPIGYNGDYFSGKLFGNNKTLKNISLIENSYYNLGIFTVLEYAYIYDLKVDTISISGTDLYYVGGLTGYCENSQIVNVSVTNASISASGDVGGIAGNLDVCTIVSANAEGEIIATDEFVGGIAGQAYPGNIIGSTTNMNISAASSVGVGGILGAETYGSVITHSYAKGSVLADVDVGGIIGYQTDDFQLYFSSFEGNLEGNSAVGGLIGSAYDSPFSINTSFAKGKIKGNEAVGGIVGNVGYIFYANDVYFSGEIEGIGSNPTDIGGIGGFVGYRFVVYRAFVDAEISSTGSNVGGFVGTAYTGSEDFILRDSFFNANISAGGNAASSSRFIGHLEDATLNLFNSYSYYDSICLIQGNDICLRQDNTTPVSNLSEFYDSTSPVFSNWDNVEKWLFSGTDYPKLRKAPKHTIEVSHACSTYSPRAGVDFNCSLSSNNTYKNAYTIVLNKENTCTWLFADGLELRGFPSIQNVGECTASFYVGDSITKSQNYTIVFNVQPSVDIQPLSLSNYYFLGSFNVGTFNDTTFTLTNHLSEAVSAIGFTNLTGTNIRFKGSSFPGTGGTCTSSLSAGASCTIVIEFNPTSAVFTTKYPVFSYTDSGGVKTKSFRLTGRGL